MTEPERRRFDCPIHRQWTSWKSRWTVIFIFLLTTLTLPTDAPCSEPDELLIVGRAHYMAGNLSEAIDPLESAAVGDDQVAAEAIYLLGRIYLLRGDFRQSKESFERAVEKCDQGYLRTSSCWRAAMGIGDALFGSGQYQEAIRRYRQATRGRTQTGPELDLKLALAEMALGREKQALERLREALVGIPVLSGWVGRERDFMNNLSMQGLAKNAPDRISRFYVSVGPVGRKVTTLEGIVLNPALHIQRVKTDGRFYLEVGPFVDSIEAVMMAETIKSGTSFGAEVVER
jgi:tetratricopeptide (TPR) repeat protein